MSEEIAKVSLKQIRNTVKLVIEVSNGNHQRDFDEIRIITKDSIEIVRFIGIYRELHIGYGSMEIPLDLNEELIQSLRELNIIK